MSNCFLRMGTNAVENAKTVLDFAMLRLQQDEAASSALFAPLGPAAVFTARPWAMLLVHDRTLMEQALAERRQSASADRPWLDAMQICQIDTIHQLRGILCTLHVSIETKALPRSIISWIQHKKDGQPPCLIVVTDLLGLLITSGQDTSIPEVLSTHQTELAAVLALLVETCQHLNTTARQRWLSAFGLENSDFTTDLLITDDGRLSSDNADDMIERILSYYIAQVM